MGRLDGMFDDFCKTHGISYQTITDFGYPILYFRKEDKKLKIMLPLKYMEKADTNVIKEYVLCHVKEEFKFEE